MANEGYDLGVAIWDFGGPDELVLGTTEIKTKGGIDANLEQTTWSPTYDQSGETPVDVVHTGYTGTITVNVASFNLQAFADIFPLARLVESGDKKKVVFGGKPGTSMMQYARTLTVRPRTLFDGKDTDLGDASEDVTYIKAIPRVNFSISYDVNTERVYPVEFTAIYDDEIDGVAVFGDNSVEED